MILAYLGCQLSCYAFTKTISFSFSYSILKFEKENFTICESAKIIQEERSKNGLFGAQL